MKVGIIGWAIFNIFVLFMLFLDLAVFHRKSHVVNLREALIASIVWILLALFFCLGLYYIEGSEVALKFLAGYLLEKSLSIDNLFVFFMIFSYFAVPEKYLHKVLFWGVLGALIMRAIFIFAGVTLIAKFHWLIYLLGILLVYTGFKLALHQGVGIDIKENLLVKLFRRYFRVVESYEEDHFFIKKNGLYWATPLFIVLLVIETTDLLFAIDSVPAILAITKDPFIVYTSNVFAILGLRALYFALQGSIQLFKYLHYGLAFLLIFIGIKMLISEWIEIPVSIVLTIIAVVISLSIIFSFAIKDKNSE